MTITTQAYQLSGWSLADLFEGHETEDMKAAFETLDARITEFEALRDQLTPEISLESFLDILRHMEENTRQVYRIYGYAGLWNAEDTQDQDAQTFMAKVQQYFAGIANRTMFFSLWWKELDDENAARLMAGSGEYSYFLEEMRNYRPHTLSEAEEKIINIKDVTGSSAMVQLFSAITNRYKFKLEVDGEIKELTRDGLMSYAYSPDPDLRAQAYQVLYKVYGDDAPILGQIYQNLVRDWRNENVELRHFASPISVRNLRNDIPDEVIETLLEVSRKNAAVFQRYFKLKARWLGVEKLRRYDIYAPTVRSDKTYEYGEAIDMVLEAFQGYEEDFVEMALRVFNDNHVDSEMRHGKRGGAFCWDVVPDLTPWVFLNFDGQARNVATMAHELGHAIHAMLASQHPIFTASAALPLAETASTFAEMVLVDHLLATETDDAVRRDLLFRQVDDAYATIMRQIFFALFEKEAHDLIQQGVSVDRLSEVYMENLKAQFGDALDVADEFRWEWVSIPHIYRTPFYVYAYAFGQLLVLALYQQYKAEGESFKPRLKKILAAGGSDSPADILAEAGIDIASADFWQGGFDVIAGLVSQLEALPVEAAA